MLVSMQGLYMSLLNRLMQNGIEILQVGEGFYLKVPIFSPTQYCISSLLLQTHQLLTL